MTRAEWQTRGSPSLLLRLMRENNASARKLLLIFYAFCEHHREREQLTEIERRLIAAMHDAADQTETVELDRAIAEAHASADDYASRYRVERLIAFANLQFPLQGIHPILDLNLASDLIRDIYHPFAPSESTFAKFRNTPLLRSLARSVYEERAFDRLPILADALEEAGCTNADILGHCRAPWPHVRGCWVVDLILGKK